MGRTHPVVVVVGAGRGSRFDGPGHKLEQPLAGRTVLACTVEHALASGLPVKVVTTARLAPLVVPMVAHRDIVLLPQSEELPHLGMGFSIGAGVSSAPGAGGWVVLPGDMPLVRPDSIRRVAEALRDSPVAYAQHAGRRGHPVAFQAELYTELARLEGDEGARRVMARYPAAAVEVDDPGVLMDVDTEADLSVVRERLAQAGSAFAVAPTALTSGA